MSCNCYAKSGVQSTKTRDEFFDIELSCFVLCKGYTVTVFSEYNSASFSEESRQHINYSYSSRKMFDSFDFSDLWKHMNPNASGFLFYSSIWIVKPTFADNSSLIVSLKLLALIYYKPTCAEVLWFILVVGWLY